MHNASKTTRKHHGSQAVWKNEGKVCIKENTLFSTFEGPRTVNFDLAK